MLCLASMLRGLKSASIILERGRCSWGKCYFCGWGKKFVNSSVDVLKTRFKGFLSGISSSDYPVIKLFCSGSFLDPNQFPRDFVFWCIEECEEKGFKHVVIESRPEFVDDDFLSRLSSYDINVHIAIGLEIADDNILINYYNKGFRVSDYVKCVEKIHRYGQYVRTYVLVNGHPILYNNPKYHREIINKTIEFIYEYSDSIVVINAYPHSQSNLFKDWLVMRWRPLSYDEFMEIVGDWYNDKKIEIDFNNFNFIPRFPKNMKIYIRGASCDILKHPYFEIWQDFILRFYEPPKDREYVLFLPCTYRKPYSKSKTHRIILSELRRYGWFRKIEIIVVSTPGVIPYEYHTYYPFTHYDWPEWEETEEIKKCYIDITYNRVRKFLERFKDRFKLYFTYFHLESETLQAIVRAFNDLNMSSKLVNILDYDTYINIKNEIGKERIGSSIIRNQKAIKKLIEVLSRYVH